MKMTVQNFASTLFGLSLLLAGAAPVLAQSAAQPAPPVAAPPAAPLGDNNRLDDAWEDVIETEGNLLTAPQFVVLTNLAYQTAAARVCDTLTLDKDAIAKAMDGLLADTGKELTVAQKDERMSAILVAYGARYGLFIAEGHTDKASFCSEASKLKDVAQGLPVYLK